MDSHGSWDGAIGSDKRSLLVGRAMATETGAGTLGDPVQRRKDCELICNFLALSGVFPLR